MAIKDIDDFEMAIKNNGLLLKYHLPRIGIFGSFARGEKANDIDVYIDSDACDSKDILEFKRELEKMAGKAVDIMLKKYANPIVLYRAQKDMKFVAA